MLLYLSSCSRASKWHFCHNVITKKCICDLIHIVTGTRNCVDHPRGKTCIFSQLKMKNNPFKSQKKLTHNILLLTLDTLASVCKFSILRSMHFLRCSLVISVTKTSPLPFFSTQIFILKLPLRVYMKHCHTTEKEIWVQVQPKHYCELFQLLTIWCGTQAVTLSLWLIDLMSTHAAWKGPTTGPFCIPLSGQNKIFSTYSIYITLFLIPPFVQGIL